MGKMKYIISEEKLNRIVKESVIRAINEGLFSDIVNNLVARKLGTSIYNDDDDEEETTASKFGPRNNPDIEMINRAKSMK